MNVLRCVGGPVPGVPSGLGQALVTLVAVEGGAGKLLRHNVAHHVVAPEQDKRYPGLVFINGSGSGDY